MSTTIDQKAYLQKYLSGSTGDKKKKKKKVNKGKGSVIFPPRFSVILNGTCFAKVFQHCTVTKEQHECYSSGL